MAIDKITDERRQRLKDWEYRVSNMDTFDIINNEELDSAQSKYDRFTGYLKEWMFDLLEKTSNTNMQYKAYNVDQDEMNLYFRVNFDFNVPRDKMDEWWKLAMDIGRGKKVENTLTKIQNPNSEDCDAVYGMFLPTYRAIKDSFDKRSIFQWIFNHKQYVAERDSLRALSGIITSLTGESKAALDKMVEDNRETMPTSDKEDLEAFIRTGIKPQEKAVVKERVSVEAANDLASEKSFMFDASSEISNSKDFENSFEMNRNK